MNPITPLVAALLGISLSAGSAFTLDAVGYDGGALEQTPYSVFVPGYGEVVFESSPGSPLAVSSAFENEDGFGGEALSFDKNDSVHILFDDEPLPAQEENRGITRASASLATGKGALLAQAFPVSHQNPREGASSQSKSWNSVPEPASVALGLMGFLLLLFRRR